MSLIKQYSRMSQHTHFGEDGFTFAIPPSEDFTDGTWNSNGSELLKSEIGVDEFQKRIYIRIDDEIKEFMTNTSSITSIAAVDITYLDLHTLVSTSTLVPGTTYFITNKKIWLLALTESLLSPFGYRAQLIIDNTAYNGFTGYIGIWSPNVTPTIGDKAIWGAQLYENTTGNVGSSLNDDELDTINWTLVTVDSMYYYKLFEIDYDFNNQIVRLQKDDRGNEVHYWKDNSQDNTLRTDWGNGSNIFHNITAGIYNNSTNSIIAYNDMKFAPIFNNYNTGEIELNKCGAIYNNYNDNQIVGNIGDFTVIHDNGGNGPINYNKMCGQIYNNTNNGISYNETDSGSIYDNTNLGYINNNITFGGDIYSNSNTSDIYINVCFGIHNNSGTGVDHGPQPQIVNNNIQGQIYNNANSGPISMNTCNGSIANNSATLSYIEYNSNNGNIIDNDGTGDISYNSNKGHISGNYTFRSIYYNSNLGHIQNNTNGNLDIYYNSNLGDIYGNINQGNTNNNSNGGVIANNDSVVTEITFNNHSGSIEGNNNTGTINNNSGSGNIYVNSNLGDIAYNHTKLGITQNSNLINDITYNDCIEITSN